MNKKTVLFLIHIPVWIVVLSFVFIMGYKSMQATDMKFLITFSIITAFWLLSSFYVFYSYLVPKYLENGKYFIFTCNAALFIIIVMPALQLSLSALNLHFFGTNHSSSNFPSVKIIFPWLGGIAGTLFCGGLGSLYRFAIDWFKNLNIKKDLENRNLRSELKTLKSKLNPHLLFNTLNNIDTLIQTTPKQASEVLSKLSDLLRYVVYDTEDEKVPLKMEIDNLKKYIDLEKIRLVNPDSVSFTTEISGNTFIPPMIFFPFVENGFKHSNLNNKNHKLIISILDNKGLIRFECINNIIEKPLKTDYNGVGLELARKRLELLFPNKHELIIQQKENEFIVKLQINTI
jgi:two-component system, LytTR family, sensor kinase